MIADEGLATRRRVPDRCQRGLTPDAIDSPGQQAEAAQSLHQAFNEEEVFSVKRAGQPRPDMMP
ncbi:hypothetical protein KO516_19620 [Citreicella sp. C3M06]|uniref:hypothetical protein n=1 Tax=Citreicella sp. C3M06 TaxID=2841564 RepID=UPI001C099957|nr:hypothetical protein [Citreicella sp. C3M06]MBU2962997.1 hypothetical protein [Citreicella sp. C3M06]